ncbi:MAG: ATP-binding cassette domain-containing protein [Proteobacteria bacterium]|nr:ATP-binding cassette domain-containing protein [Pseudomonadota bacterium]
MAQAQPTETVHPAQALLRVENLRKYYPKRSGLLQRVTGAVKAVDGVDFTIGEGETLGLVGESGCGKSTISSMIVGLNSPTGGSIHFDGLDITNLKRQHNGKLCRELQIVFQDPYSSLNPRMTIFETVAEPLVIHEGLAGTALRDRVMTLLAQVGLRDEHAGRYPSQFSGGQRQRIGIARALALNPRLIVLDEPVSALDVSIQAQILNLLKKLQRDLGLSYLFISHNLSVVRYMATRIAVMYLGRIVEVADRETLFAQPAHPYTRALLSSIPSDDPFVRVLGDRIKLAGDAPSPAAPPPGCPFHVRCFQAQPNCAVQVPDLTPRGTPAREVACHYPLTVSPKQQ